MARKKRQKQWRDLSIRDVEKMLKKGVNIMAKKVEEKTR